MSILIHNCTAVLMDEAGTVLPNAYVVVGGTKIRSVSTQRPWGSFEEQIDGQGNVLMPGFVNAHSHVPMTAMRGYGDGNNLQDWLHNYIFPVEARREHGLGMHVHISETRTEHDECLARHGKTPIQVLNDYGVWDVRAIAAHCVWTTPEDWSVMASKGVSAIHNPMSNLKLGSGIAPRPRHGQGRCQRVPGHRRRVLQQLHRLLRGHEAGRHSPQRGQLRPPGPAAHRRPAHGHRQRRQGPGAAHRPD